jgi:hypothetical protein
LRHVPLGFSQRELIAQDSNDNLWHFDLDRQRKVLVGVGRRPTWSPEGHYVLVRRPSGDKDVNAPSEAFFLVGDSTNDRPELGTVRDSRWIPSAACARVEGK